MQAFSPKKLPLAFLVHVSFYRRKLKSTDKMPFIVPNHSIEPFIYPPGISWCIIAVTLLEVCLSPGISFLFKLWLNPHLYLLHICFLSDKSGCRKHSHNDCLALNLWALVSMGLLMLPEVILYFPSLFLYPDPLKNISYLSPFLKPLVFSS